VSPNEIIKAYQAFFADERRPLDVISFFRDVVASVPAYRKFLADAEIDPAAIRSVEDFRRLPMTSKAAYANRYPLPELCRGGTLDGCDIIAVSSGSSGQPAIWPRSVVDELQIAERFEQVFRTFHADSRRTLAVGYPPIVKDVIDSGTGWPAYRIKMVFAGEVFSEEWRDLVASRAGVADPVSDMVSLYGTADAGVLGNETPKSVSIRRFRSGNLRGRRPRPAAADHRGTGTRPRSVPPPAGDRDPRPAATAQQRVRSLCPRRAATARGAAASRR
jgi:phenylacetate-CoA ligase